MVKLSFASARFVDGVRGFQGFGDEVSQGGQPGRKTGLDALAELDLMPLLEGSGHDASQSDRGDDASDARENIAAYNAEMIAMKLTADVPGQSAVAGWLADHDSHQDGSLSFDHDHDHGIIEYAKPSGKGGGGGGKSGEATIQEMADYIFPGYFVEKYGFVFNGWNLSDTGSGAKSGTINYVVTANAYDADGLSAQKMEAVREAMGIIKEMTGITFKEVTADSGERIDIYYQDDQRGNSASYNFAGGDYMNYSVITHGIDATLTAFSALHEIGHTLGISHPGPYNAGSGSAIFSNDAYHLSVMSYFSPDHQGLYEYSHKVPTTFKAADLMALDKIYSKYGLGTQTAFTDDTVFGWNTNISAETHPFFASLAERLGNLETNPNGGYSWCIVDGGGTDTLDFSGANGVGEVVQIIDLTPTLATDTAPTGLSVNDSFGDFNITLAVGTVIENAIGTQTHDIITGNDVDNILDGQKGDDTLFGGAGNDTLSGGEGSDALFGGAGIDTLDLSSETVDLTLDVGGSITALDGSTDSFESIEVFIGGAGRDTLSFASQRSAADVDLASTSAISDGLAYNFAGFENVTGSGGDDILRGDAGANVLNGDGGDDVLVGRAGADSLIGGGGVDTADYSSSTGNVQVDLGLGIAADGTGATDSLREIENVQGSAFDDSLIGNAEANLLRGGLGADRLFGAGGNDDLFGGIGADIFAFTFDSDKDRVFDFEAGIDKLEFAGQTLADLSIKDTRSGAQISYGNRDQIVLEGVFEAQIMVDDFVFV